jgi:hypothetical protein
MRIIRETDKYNYTELHWQYQKAMQHDNWERAYRLEREIKRRNAIMEANVKMEFNKNRDRETLVTIIIEPFK